MLLERFEGGSEVRDLSTLVCVGSKCANVAKIADLFKAFVYSNSLLFLTTSEARNDIMDYSGKFPVDLLANEMKEDFFGKWAFT